MPTLTDTPHSNDQASSGRRLSVLSAAAICQSVPFAFLFMGVPGILRDLNESLTTITLYSLLLFPWAGRFLYAPFLDRIYSKRIGRRRTWLLASLLATSVLLVLTALFIPAGSSPALMASLFLMNLTLSVNDTVVGAYSSDILAYKEMSWAGTIRTGGSYLGMILGGGLLLSCYGTLGWKTTFLLLGGLTLLMALPATLPREIAPVHRASRENDGDRPNLLAFLRSRHMGWFILAEILFVTSLYSATQIYPPFLIDQGLGIDDIGRVLMFWGYPLGFVTAILSGWMMRHVSPARILCLSMAAETCLLAYAFHLAGSPSVTPAQGIVLLCSDMALGCLSGVAFYTLLTAFCVGPQAAANVGLLASIANATPLLVPPLLGRLGDTCGYQALYAVMAGVSLLFFLLVAAIFRTRLSGLEDRLGLNGRAMPEPQPVPAMQVENHAK